jgi:hypothetical protein
MEYYWKSQEVFRKVVKDTIVQDDVTVTISDMRTAIANTHLTLNFAIMPGVILIPSDLRILTEPIPGFRSEKMKKLISPGQNLSNTLQTVPI